MNFSSLKSLILMSICAVALGACGNGKTKVYQPTPLDAENGKQSKVRGTSNGSLFDIFREGPSSVKVNRFLWNASLDVLNFLPVQAADPFTGVITTGYGIPPGGGQAYRATILISDPALDARSLNVALQTRSGRPVSAGTQRAVEDAILSRARQMRIDAGRF